MPFLGSGLRRKLVKHLVTAVQAVLTHSFFVSQWERPVAVQEYLLPAARTLAFPDVRACLHAPANLTAASAAWYRPQYFNKKQMMGVYLSHCRDYLLPAAVPA